MEDSFSAAGWLFVKEGKKKIVFCESKCNLFYKLWFVSQYELMLILNCCRYYIYTAF